jgi:hypothetical protein
LRQEWHKRSNSRQAALAARHESLPSLPCDYLKIDLPLVGHRVGASHPMARAFGQELANDDKPRQAPAIDFMHHLAARSIYSLSHKAEAHTELNRHAAHPQPRHRCADRCGERRRCDVLRPVFRAGGGAGALGGLRQSRVGPAEAEKICRTYGKNFYEAVEVRQAAALCEDSAVRKRNLDTLDAEIDAFNKLIAVQCIGS